MLQLDNPEANISRKLSPFGRIDDSKDVATLVCFFLSDTACHTSGPIIPADTAASAGFSGAVLNALAEVET
ncbi:MAG: hypothetical protein AAF311_00765 [Pseudomonadota bacterium]